MFIVVALSTNTKQQEVPRLYYHKPSSIPTFSKRTAITSLEPESSDHVASGEYQHHLHCTTFEPEHDGLGLRSFPSGQSPNSVDEAELSEEWIGNNTKEDRLSEPQETVK